METIRDSRGSFFKGRSGDLFFAVMTAAMAIHELLIGGNPLLETTLWFSLHALTAFIFLIRGAESAHPGGRWFPALVTAASLSFPFMLDYDSDVALVPSPVGGALMAMGGALAIASILSLGRSFGVFPAVREVRLGGMYRLVRHPMYASYIIMDCALVLTTFTASNLLVLGIALVLYVLRIREEERLLVRLPAYAAYSNTIRWRLIPGVY